MRAAKARRLRFAILSARSLLAPGRLTSWQAQFLDGITDELMIGDTGTMKAHDREYRKQYAKYMGTETA
jgi:hypothetical protein